MAIGINQLHVKLTPKAASNRVVEVGETEAGTVKHLKVYVTALPEAGKANEAMIEVLAKHYHLPKSAFTIQRGKQSRNKIIRIV